MFRVGDLANVAASEPHFCYKPDEFGNLIRVSVCLSQNKIVSVGEPHCCSKMHNRCVLAGALAEIGGTAIMVVQKSDEIQSAFFVIAKWAKSLYRRGRGLEQNAELVEEAEEIRDIPVFHLNMTQLTADHVNQHFEEVYQSLQYWRELETIPDEISMDPVLSKFKCGITQRCIRFIVSAKTNRTEPVDEYELDDMLERVYYERAEVQRLLLQESPTPPPGWPEGLAFTAVNVKAKHSLQAVINGQLKAIAKQWEQHRSHQNQNVS